jgi:hypothetical protein
MLSRSLRDVRRHFARASASQLTTAGKPRDLRDCGRSRVVPYQGRAFCRRIDRDRKWTDLREVVLAAVVVVVSLASSSSSCAEESTPFSRLTAFRREIAAGHIVVSIEGRQVVFDESGRHPLEKRYSETAEIWFDGEKLRGDWTPTGSGQTVVSCFGCAGPGTHVYFDNAVLPGGRKLALSIGEAAAINVPKDSVPHPRWIGVVPAPFRLTSFLDAEEILSSGRRSESQSLPDGSSLISWENGRGGQYEVRLRQNPPAIEHLTLKYDHEGKQYEESLVVQSAVHTIDAKEVSYPKTIQFQQTIEGVSTIEEAVQVKEADFTPPDPAVFSLSTIPSLLPGTPVHWALPRDRPAPAGVPLEWNGSGIVGMYLGQAERGAQPSAESTRATIRHILITVNVMILTVIGGVWAFRCLRNHHRTRVSRR